MRHGSTAPQWQKVAASSQGMFRSLHLAVRNLPDGRIPYGNSERGPSAGDWHVALNRLPWALRGGAIHKGDLTAWPIEASHETHT